MKTIFLATLLLTLISVVRSEAHDENCRYEVQSVIRCISIDKSVALSITHKRSIQDPTTTLKCTKDLTHPFWAVFEMTDANGIGNDGQIQSVVSASSGETEENIASIATDHIHLNYDRIVNRAQGISFDLILAPSQSRAVWSSQDDSSTLRAVPMNCQRSVK